MTWRTWIWRGPFIVMFALMALPMAALLIPINLMDDADSDRVIGNSLMIVSFLVIALMHNWLSIRPGKIRLGFFPFYWRSLSSSDVRYVIRVEFSPWRDFAGWGMKGLAKSRNGLLLGGNPGRGIMIETHDRRRYVLSFAEVDPILRALAAQGYTISEVPLIDEESAPSES